VIFPDGELSFEELSNLLQLPKVRLWLSEFGIDSQILRCFLNFWTMMATAQSCMKADQVVELNPLLYDNF